MFTIPSYWICKKQNRVWCFQTFFQGSQRLWILNAHTCQSPLAGNSLCWKHMKTYIKTNSLVLVSLYHGQWTVCLWICTPSEQTVEGKGTHGKSFASQSPAEGECIECDLQYWHVLLHYPKKLETQMFSRSLQERREKKKRFHWGRGITTRRCTGPRGTSPKMSHPVLIWGGPLYRWMVFVRENPI